MSSLRPLLVGTSTGLTATALMYCLYDYQTCHPFRKMQGFSPLESAIRLHNTIRPQWTYPTLTLQELSDYRIPSPAAGNGGTVYFSSDGYIWDVSHSETFQQMYRSKWAGKDATFALAKMSMEHSNINRTDYHRLTQEEWDSVRSWTKYFQQKYWIRGILQEFQDQMKQ
mmetsp:Transcript_15392/g.27776  ORF Transcript_15392/g.27776 Transcript_15392/m.27776 type:complete len:169 (+) Transcript_15392:38-544(+)